MSFCSDLFHRHSFKKCNHVLTLKKVNIIKKKGIFNYLHITYLYSNSYFVDPKNFSPFEENKV